MIGDSGGTAGMFVSLWLACVCFLIPLEKRSHPWVRSSATLAAAAVTDGILALFQPSLTWEYLVAMFVFSVLFFLMCGDMHLSGLLYAAVWAQISQQVVTETCLLLYWYFSPWVDWGTQAWLAVSVLLFGAAYSTIALTVARWMPVHRKYTIGPRQLTLSLTFLSVFETLCWALFTGMRLGVTSFLYPVSIWLAQCYCATLLYFQHTLFTKSTLKKELEILNRLWHEKEEQYRLSKETIAIINRKCHDMKHQLAAVRAMKGAESQEKYLREVEESVGIYDAMFQTGHEVLDTVLTEKSLYCGVNDIRLSCVADGKQLAFMDPVDVYTILGNALDNAIDGVQRLKESEKRMIDVLICREKKFLVIQVSNPLEEKLEFQSGLPVSTKPQDGYHGFGLKSIRHTAAQYDGFATVNTENDSFVLKILIPLRDENLLHL